MLTRRRDFFFPDDDVVRKERVLEWHRLRAPVLVYHSLEKREAKWKMRYKIREQKRVDAESSMHFLLLTSLIKIYANKIDLQASCQNSQERE